MADEPDFAAALETHRGELHRHCYRLLGSLADADDAVQETFLRAWKSRRELRAGTVLGAWLYRIATNACLDELRRRRRRPRASEAVDPYPEALLTSDDGDPGALLTLRESVSLAFAATLQLLTPRQRSVLVLRDVLDWSATEAASALSLSEDAVASALYRARATLAREAPTWRADAASLPEDEATRELAMSYSAAWHTADVDGLVALLREDARYAMPPFPLVFAGRAGIAEGLRQAVFTPGARYRLVETRAGSRLAFGAYRAEGDGWTAVALHVLTLDGSSVAEVCAYLQPELVGRAGLPLHF